MAIDYAEKEREFLDSLAEDTGRDLAGWMTAIRDANLDDRNAIIDWLRRQGFLFARASWLERIHHNGGRPIYLSPTVGVASAAPPRVSASPTQTSPVGTAPAATAPQLMPPPVIPFRKPFDPQARPLQPTATKPATLSLETVLAEAKGYRPLAQFVLRAIEQAAPALSIIPHAGYIALRAGDTVIGILTVSPKELRLALAGAAGDPLDGFTRAKFTKTQADIPASMTHMVVLTDARQVTAELMAAVAGAAAVDRAAPLPD